MQLQMPQYEMRHFDDSDWIPISEKSMLHSLCDSLECVSQIIKGLHQGQEILLQGAIYRMRKHH